LCDPPKKAASTDKLLIRKANPNNALAIAKLVRSSMSELCFDNDDKIDLWLVNKTREDIFSWIIATDFGVFVSTCSTGLAAVGCYRETV